MSERLIGDPDGIATLAAQVAAQIGIPAVHVEKDFWVTEVLRGVTASANEQGVPIIFKGGTSLSKAFGIISRFSEDVDILVLLSDEDSSGAKDRTLKALVKGAEAATGLESQPDPGSTSKGLKRGARFYYRGGGQAGGVSEGVFLELGSRGGRLPSDLMEVTSLIASHAHESIAGTIEAEPVSVLVMDPLRTLVEKLIILHTTHSDDAGQDAARNARHYYDVHQLLSRGDVISRLNSAQVAFYADDVCTYSSLASRPASRRPASGFAGSPAFTGGAFVNMSRSAYEVQVLAQLVWPGAPHPSFEECVDIVRINGGLL